MKKRDLTKIFFSIVILALILALCYTIYTYAILQDSSVLVVQYIVKVVICLLFAAYFLRKPKEEKNYWLLTLILTFTLANACYFLYYYVNPTRESNNLFWLNNVGGISQLVGYACILVEIFRHQKLNFYKNNWLYALGIAIILGYTSYLVISFLPSPIFDVRNLITLIYIITVSLLLFSSFVNFVSTSSPKGLIMFIACILFLVAEYVSILAYTYFIEKTGSFILILMYDILPFAAIGLLIRYTSFKGLIRDNFNYSSEL
ncbi:hypothetical protein [Gangjinia marincola]